MTMFKELWAATLGEESSWVVDVCIGLMCLACCIIYSGILGDVFTPLLMVAGVPPRFNTRSSNILLITAAVLAPLSLLEDLTKLAFTSMVGCLAVLYTVLFIARRALDGSYVSGEEHRPNSSPKPSPSPNPNPIPEQARSSRA